jgi:hypothetical protein
MVADHRPREASPMRQDAGRGTLSLSAPQGCAGGHSGTDERGRQLRRPFLQEATINTTVRPTKARNPPNTDATHIFSNIAIPVLPMRATTWKQVYFASG